MRFIKTLYSLAALAILSLGLSACATKYEASPVAIKDVKSISSFFIASSNNAQANFVEYEGSGAELAIVIEQELKKYIKKYYSTSQRLNKDYALKLAKAQGYDFLLYSTLEFWENEPTSWSGASDIVTVTTYLYNTANGKLLDTISISGNTSNIKGLYKTPRSIIRDHYEEYFDSLFSDYQ